MKEPIKKNRSKKKGLSNFPMKPFSPHKPAKIAGIILAAGMGTRMGSTKQLLSLGGLPVLEWVIQNGLAANLDPLILVLGHEANKIMEMIVESRTRVVINSRYKSGMSASIRAGLAAVGPQCDGVMFLLGDQPQVPSPILKTLIQAFTSRGNTDLPNTNQAHTNPIDKNRAIVIPTFQGRQGNPVIFGRHFFPKLDRLTGDTGGRALFKTHPENIIRVPVNTDAVCFDLDTPEDYKRLCQREKK